MTGNPLWTFSLDLYDRKEVADSCLALQDGCGADVNILLYLLWCAATGRLIDMGHITAADAEIKAWRRDVIAPLRSIRRAMKNGLLSGVDTGPCRSQVKALEIETERLAQTALFQIAPLPRGGGPAGLDFTERYLGLYATYLGTTFAETHQRTLRAALD